MPKLDTTLVIPGKNCAATVAACLDAVASRVDKTLAEIVFVNDGSTDNTAKIVARYPVRVIMGAGKGPAAARNLGWRAANTPLVWFIDSDCVAERGALEILLENLKSEKTAGVGGSYGNMRPESLLACLIHEEIAERHRRMPARVNYLGSFNVLYRKDVLQQLGGFDERYVTSEDVELSYRISAAHYELAFDERSKVGHYHPDALLGYLKTQARHGYWRAVLYAKHPVRVGGDSYSGFTDHVQPILAAGSLALVPLTPLLAPAVLQLPLAASLAAAQIPMTLRILGRTRSPLYASFAAMSYVRAYARGLGLVVGAAHAARRELFGDATVRRAEGKT